MPEPFITKSVADAEGNASVEISDPTTGVRVKVNADGQLLVDVGGLNINPGDINIGAVELKDHTTDDRARVKTDGTDIALTVRQNNQPLPTGAATQTTLAEIAVDTDNLAGIKVGTDKLIAAPATEAKQDVANASLASLDTKAPALSGGKVPVTNPTALPLPTGAATEAKQDTGNTSLASLDAKLTTLLAQTDGLEASLSSVDTKTPALSGGNVPVASSPIFGSRSDTFSATGNGTTVNRSTSPVKSFAISVKGTGGAATAWDVRLEGSLDGTSWTQLIQHTNTLDGDGATKFQLAGIATPILYFRSRCAGLTLGVSATDIVVTILGVN